MYSTSKYMKLLIEDCPNTLNIEHRIIRTAAFRFLLSHPSASSRLPSVVNRLYYYISRPRVEYEQATFRGTMLSLLNNLSRTTRQVIDRYRSALIINSLSFLFFFCSTTSVGSNERLSLKITASIASCN